MNIPFCGSVLVPVDKNRLYKLVTRNNGSMRKNQRFSLVLKSKAVKEHLALPFQFHCSYYKEESGYRVRWFTFLSGWGLLRLLIGIVLVGALIVWRQLDLWPVFGACSLLYLINFFVQLNRCRKQFLAILKL